MLQNGSYPAIHEGPRSDVFCVMQLGCMDAASVVAALAASAAAGASAAEASAAPEPCRFMHPSDIELEGDAAYATTADARDLHRIMHPSHIAPEGACGRRSMRTIH